MLFKSPELLFLYKIVKLHINVKLMRKGKKNNQETVYQKAKIHWVIFLIELNKVIRLFQIKVSIISTKT